MWILTLSYIDDCGNYYNNKVQIFKNKEDAELIINEELDMFRDEAIDMIQLYNTKKIIYEIYDRLDINEIENILSNDSMDEETKIKKLTKKCYCCFNISPVKLNMDSDIILEHSFPP